MKNQNLRNANACIPNNFLVKDKTANPSLNQ